MWDLRTLGQFHGSGMPPGLFEDFMDAYAKCLRLPLSLAELWFTISVTPTQQVACCCFCLIFTIQYIITNQNRLKKYSKLIL